MKRFILFLAVWSMVFSFALINLVSANSTIGTSITTTGTLTVTNGSTTAVKFQNAASTTIFQFDTTNSRLGIAPGGALQTALEVGGTASATNVITSGAVQFASNAASVAYSRFGASTTKRSNYITASNDILVSGDIETVGSVAFGGTASVSGIFFMTDGQHRPSANSTTAFRFQNAAGSTNVLTIDTTNTRVGINAGGAVDTTFEVGGAASISGNASVSGNFELTGASALFGLNAGTLIDTSLEVGGTASISGIITLAGSGSTGGQIRPAVNATTAFRFQNAAGTTNVLTIDTTNARVGVGNIGGALNTVFEVGGTASATNVITSGAVQFASNAASVAYSRFGSTTTGHANYISASDDLLVSGDAEVRGSVSFATIASVGTNFNVGEKSAATTSITFETNAATKGACFVLTGSNGTKYYARIVASGSSGAEPKWWITTVDCR